MKIVQIGGALNGAQKIIEEAIHHRAIEMGHESYIFYAWGQSNESRIIQYGNKLENLFTRALRKYVGKKSRYSAPQTRRLIRYIKRIKPDVIHLHVLHHGYTDYEMLFKYLVKAQIPVVYTMHDMWAFTGGCYHYHSLKCSGFQTGCTHCPNLSQGLDNEVKNVENTWNTKKMLLLKLKNLHFVAVSSWVAEEMKRSFLASFPVSVIPNGVPKYICKSLSIDSDPIEKARVICVAASWTKAKGLDTLIELASMLTDEVELLMVGGVSEEAKKNAPSNMLFYGYCRDREHMRNLYQTATVHVSASKEETYGMTFVEAALAGTRSIGFACTAIGETLKGVHGISVTEYTAQALKTAILTVIGEQNGKLSVEEIMEVEKEYSVDSMADKYLNLYQRVVHG